MNELYVRNRLSTQPYESNSLHKILNGTHIIILNDATTPLSGHKRRPNWGTGGRGHQDLKSSIHSSFCKLSYIQLQIFCYITIFAYIRFIICTTDYCMANNVHIVMYIFM